MIEILGGGSRLSKSKEVALNRMLIEYGGAYQGQPFYRLSWAADDNLGLAKNHNGACGKTDPFDWDCTCPANPDKMRVPVCFYEIQQSYHLLSWNPPSLALVVFEEQLRQDMNKGNYDCVMHFVDPETRNPIDPTATLLERVIPVLVMGAEALRAQLYDNAAAFERERLARINREFDRRKRTDAAADAFAEDRLADFTTFGGAPHTGYGPKSRQSADIQESDLKSNIIIVDNRRTK